MSTVSRVGNHEVVRVRPFVRIAGNLSLTVSELSANIPPYNPQRMLAESAPGGEVTAEDAAVPEPDAEVAFVTHDLAAMLPHLRIALVTPTEEVTARVRDAAAWIAKSPPSTGRSLPILPASSSPMPATTTPTIPMPALRRASCPRTSRCCRRPPIRSPAAIR